MCGLSSYSRYGCEVVVLGAYNAFGEIRASTYRYGANRNIGAFAYERRGVGLPTELCVSFY